MDEVVTSPVRASRLLKELRRDDAELARAERDLGSRLLLARNVLRLRVRAGLTQTELAKRASMSQPRIAEIESARQNATLDVLDRIAAAFSVRVASLLEDRPSAVASFDERTVEQP